jgi:hypothetical protein
VFVRDTHRYVISCTHEYRYRITYTSVVAYEYRHELVEYNNAEFIHALKAGYGFTPTVTITYSGIELLSDRIISAGVVSGPIPGIPGVPAPQNQPLGRFGCGVAAPGQIIIRATAPGSTQSRFLPQAVVSHPDHALFSWGRTGFSLPNFLNDYVLLNPHRNTRQFAENILMDHRGFVASTTPRTDIRDFGGRISFIPLPNALSATDQRRIYCSELLRDGRHDFSVFISGGMIRYTPDANQPESLAFAQCLTVDAFGHVNILGTMYEDDFTGEAPWGR